MERKLTELCDIQYGFAFDSAKFSEDSKYHPLVRIRDVQRGYSETYYAGDYPKEYILHKGDLLIGMDGEFNIARWKSRDALLNQRVCKVTAKEGTSEEYLRFALSKALKEIENRTAFVTVKHLSAKELNKLILNIPLYSEQVVIADILSKLERIIVARQRELQKLDDLIKAQFVEMFGDPVENSKGFELVPLGDLGILKRGTSKHRPRNDAILLGGKYPLIQTGDVSNAKDYITEYTSTYSEIGLKQSKMWSKGTLCITIAANIAETAILSFDACFPDSVVGFIPGEKVTTLFIHNWFKFLQPILEENAPAVAQKNLNVATLEKTDVIVPPIELQNEYETFIKQIGKSKFAVQKALDKAQLLFDSLMQKHFG